MSAQNLVLMRQIDELHLQWPFYGSRKIAHLLDVNRKRVQRHEVWSTEIARIPLQTVKKEWPERERKVVRGGIEPPTPGFSVLCSTY